MPTRVQKAKRFFVSSFIIGPPESPLELYNDSCVNFMKASGDDSNVSPASIEIFQPSSANLGYIEATAFDSKNLVASIVFDNIENNFEF